METNMLIKNIGQFGHLFKYFLTVPNIVLDKGMLIISIDIDVGNKELGLIHQGKNDYNVNDFMSEFSVGAIEEIALPMFLELFKRFNHPATFAIRGEWLDHHNEALDQLLSNSVKHDIGGHGYSHAAFDRLNAEAAHKELKNLRLAMKRHNKFPTSFVFPKNHVAHLNLLPMYGFRSYRSRGGIRMDALSIADHGQLWDVRPGLQVCNTTSYVLTKKIFELCIRRKLPFHIWFHLWDFGNTQNCIQKKIMTYFQPLLQYALFKTLEGTLEIRTMSSAVEDIRVNQ